MRRGKAELPRFARPTEAYKIAEGWGGAAPSIDEIIGSPRQAGRIAIHPGYGLLVGKSTDSRSTPAAAPADHLHRHEGRDDAPRWRQAGATGVASKAGCPSSPGPEVLGEGNGRIPRRRRGGGYPSARPVGRGGSGICAVCPKGTGGEGMREGRREGEAVFGNGEGVSGKDDPARSASGCRLSGDSHGNIYHSTSATAACSAATRSVSGTRHPRPISARPQREENLPLGKKDCEHVNYDCAGMPFEF